MSERPPMGLHLVRDEAPAVMAAGPVSAAPADLAAAVLMDAGLALAPVPVAVDAVPADAVDGPVAADVDKPVDGPVDTEAAEGGPHVDNPAGTRPAMTLPGEEMTPWQLRYADYLIKARVIIAGIKAAANQEGATWTDSPPSLSHIAAYYAADPAPWVSRDYTGSLLITWGRNYGRFIAIPGAAFGYSIAWVFARPYRLAVALTILGAVLLPLFL